MSITNDMVDAAQRGEIALADRHSGTTVESVEGLLSEIGFEDIDHVAALIIERGLEGVRTEMVETPEMLRKAMTEGPEAMLQDKVMNFSTSFARGLVLGVLLGRASVPTGIEHLPETKERD